MTSDEDSVIIALPTGALNGSSEDREFVKNQIMTPSNSDPREIDEFLIST